MLALTNFNQIISRLKLPKKSLKHLHFGYFEIHFIQYAQFIEN